MPWVRLDDEMLDNGKVAEVGPLGFAMHVAAIIYCGRNLTDGKVKRSRLRSLLDFAGVYVDAGNDDGYPHDATNGPGAIDNPDPVRLAVLLVEVGLWERDGRDYLVHDYLDYNPSRAAVEADRKAARERMQKHRSSRDS
jgi:hypothetical protein